MTRKLAIFAFLLALSACDRGGPIAPDDLRVVVRVAGEPADEKRVFDVASGRAFEVEIVRSWRLGMRVDPPAAEPAPPLRLVPIETRRREDGRFVEETTRYRAYAFDPGTCNVPPPMFVASTEDGETRGVRGAPIRLNVAPALGDDAVGEPEPPPDLVEPPSSRTLAGAVVAAFVALAAGGAFILKRRFRSPPAPPPAPPPIAPKTRALLALAGAPKGEAASDIDSAIAIVRAYLAEARGLPASRRTTEETAAAAEIASSAGREILLRALMAADEAKFAGATADAPRATSVRDDVRAFLDAEPDAPPFPERVS